eukprot:g17477.t1
MTIKQDTRNELSFATFAAKPILAFFEEKHFEIWHAARLLGGYDASRIVDKCAARLEAIGCVDNQVLIMLDQILSTLSLEEVDDPDKPFMGFFAVIDPSDPAVEEICLLTDGLRDAMTACNRRMHWAHEKEHCQEAA